MADAESVDLEQQERKSRIEKLVSAIAARSKGKPKLKRKMADREGVPPLQEVRRGRPPKRTLYKLHMGWLHYDENKKRYKQVHAKNGGGTRIIEFQKDEPETVHTLLERGKKLFFPNGNSCNGQSLSNMDVCMSSYNGMEISEFQNEKGICSLQEYLKSQGIYSSQYYIYVKTRRQNIVEDNLVSDENSLPTSRFLVDGKSPAQIQIKYVKECSSTYSNENHYICCNSMKSCFELNSSTRRSQTFEDYNPFEDGYTVKWLKVGDQVVYEREQSGVTTYFGSTDNTCMDFEHIRLGENCFLITPHQLHGYEQASSDCEHLIFAVVSNQNDPFISWYKNGEEIASGINLSAICVLSPGIYTVAIKLSDVIYMVDPPMIVTSDESDIEAGPMTTEDSAGSSGLPRTEATPVKTEDSAGGSGLPRTQATPVTTEDSAWGSGLPRTEATGVTTDDSAGGSGLPRTEATQVTTDDVAWGSDLLRIEATPVTTEDSAGGSGLPRTVATPVTTEESAWGSGLPRTEATPVTTEDSAGSSGLPRTQATTVMTEESAGGSGLPRTEATPVTTEESAWGRCLPRTEATRVTTEDSAGSSDHPRIEATPVTTEDSAWGSGLPRTQATPVTTEDSAGGSGLPRTEATPVTTEDSAGGSGLPRTEATPVTTEDSAGGSGLPRTEATPVKTEDSAGGSGLPRTEATPVTTEESAGGSGLPRTEAIRVATTVGVPTIPFQQIKIGQEIGRGGFGTVYNGSWLGTEVAVKEITIKRMRINKRMVEREIKILSEIRHPNICLLMGYSSNLNNVYLVSELIIGSNLDEILFGASEVDLNLEAKTLIARKVTQGIVYLHNQATPIIHGDIKPENVLISSDLRSVRICDMGLSRMKSMNTIVTTFAHSSSLQPGTPAYQAPEILIHKQSVTSNTDIWSLACTILELMCSVPCWKFGTEDDLVFIITKMNGKVQPDAMQDIMMQDDIQKPILAILTQSFDYWPEGRPTAFDVLKALA